MEDQNRFEPVKRAAERHNVDAVARYRGLNRLCCFGSWGLRPRLYAYARYRGLRVNTVASDPGACAPGFMLTPAIAG